MYFAIHPTIVQIVNAYVILSSQVDFTLLEGVLYDCFRRSVKLASIPQVTRYPNSNHSVIVIAIAMYDVRVYYILSIVRKCSTAS